RKRSNFGSPAGIAPYLSWRSYLPCMSQRPLSLPWAKKVAPEREILQIVKKAESLRFFFARCASCAVHKKFTVNIH
ncbi:MAG: hypothetical protein IIT47_00840, partial [Oscillospiraceae bacterium]|nr:hypothetical protein [Oscillospiraceae bacterium]